MASSVNDVLPLGSSLPRNQNLSRAWPGPYFETEPLPDWSSSYSGAPRGSPRPEKTRGQPNCPPQLRPDTEQLKPMPAQTQTGFSTPMNPQHRVWPLWAPPSPSARGCPIAAEPRPCTGQPPTHGPQHIRWPRNMLPHVPCCRQGGMRSLGPEQANLKR